jgi:NADPH-dependent 2,4-dienoyl-CoA reductase/sulfur reductase-like enzyme
MNTIERVKVVVIGAGPAGVGVAIGLARRGIRPVVLIDRQESVGGIPSLYKKKPGGVPTFVLWTEGRVVFGEQFAGRLADKLRSLDVEIWLDSQVIEVFPAEKKITLVNPSRGRFEVSAEAVVLACGAREKTAAERGWIDGSRSSGMLFTRNLLDLVDRHNIHLAGAPVILGSDLIAHAAAAKLKSAGASDVVMVDRSASPDCNLPARLYFSRWAKPRYEGSANCVTLAGERSVSTVTTANGTQVPCDLVMLCGDLIPNTELALMGNLRVDPASRQATVDSDYQLSEPGWFAAGNMLGDYHGAERCYFNGRRVASQVAKYLRRAASRD